MKVPIYRPEITVYHRDADGLWVSLNGTITATLFYPMPDEDLVRPETGLRRVVQYGEEPFYTIEVPEGSYLAHGLKATILARKDRPCFLYTPDSRGVHDPINAVISAKRGEDGFRLVRPGRPDEVVDPPAASVVDREWVEKPFGPSTWTDRPQPNQASFAWASDEPEPRRKRVRR